MSNTVASKVAITGMGVVTPLASTPEALFNILHMQGQSLQEWDDLREQGFSNAIASRMPQDTFRQGFGRGKELALNAARNAMDYANISSHNMGVFVGTCMGESSVFEAAATDETLDIRQGLGSEYAKYIKDSLKLNGPVRTFSCACASGNYAIGAAAQMIQSGDIESAVAGGVESFSRIAHLGFIRSRAMSTDQCKPFDFNRNGMQLGEASAFLCLERADIAHARGATIYAYVSSLGLSCDAHHATAPKVDGTGMSDAMLDALKKAKIKKEQISWICAHGTGTKLSDAAECKAIERVFGESACVFGIKGSLGHSLGASSAVEAVVSTLALYHNFLPPTVGIHELDPNFSVDVVRSSRRLKSSAYAMSCAYGFGGINSALVLQKS